MEIFVWVGWLFSVGLGLYLTIGISLVIFYARLLGDSWTNLILPGMVGLLGALILAGAIVNAPFTITLK